MNYYTCTFFKEVKKNPIAKASTKGSEEIIMNNDKAFNRRQLRKTEIKK